MKIFLGVLVLAVVAGLVPQTVLAQTADFNINTQVVDLRSSGSNGPDALNPGFDPCAGGTRSSAGVCEGTAIGLLKPTNLTALFPTLGTGAVTDNMFGRIAVNSSPNCTSFDSAGSGFQAGLNCGDLRSTPDSQGQSIPETLDTAGSPINTLSDIFSTDNAFTGDFCNGSTNNCGTAGAAHAGFDITNTFSWTPTGASSASASVSQIVRQVTALNPSDTIGTIGTPGDGDQLFQVATSWTNTTNANGTFDPPVISWSQIIQDPNQSGLGPAFSVNVSGTFTANQITAPPAATYPSGSSQTDRSQGLEPTASETLP